MRYVLVAIFAIALFAAGFLAANAVQSDADAQGTWQYQTFDNARDELIPFLNGLPSDCAVDMETIASPGYLDFIVAYSCPD